MDAPTTITRRKVLVGEGKDECGFFSALLRFMGIHDVQVDQVKGKVSHAALRAFVNRPGFENVRVLAIVRDADDNPAGAFESIINSLDRCGLPFPNQAQTFASNGQRDVGVFILPDATMAGMLESLCLQSVADHPAIRYVNTYIDSLRMCLTLRDPLDAPEVPGVRYFPKSEPKAAAQVFLAAMHEIQREIGTAAQAGCWKLDHACMADLRRFLEAFRTAV